MIRTRSFAARGALIVTTVALLVLGAAGAAAGTDQESPSKPGASAGGAADTDVPAVLRFKVKDLDGKEVDLKKYQGDVILLVNTASKCGYTPQYADMQKVYEQYKDRGFVVLAFPSNDFGRQEPLDSKGIREFCTDKFKATFPIFEKVVVNPPDAACDLYKYLTDKKNFRQAGPIKWNFTKFLIDRKGEVKARFEPGVAPTEQKVTARIEALLEAERPAKSGAAGSDQPKSGGGAKGGNR